MSRTMPYECEHGVVIDWGDFGPCQDCEHDSIDDCPNFARCDECDRKASEMAIDSAIQMLRTHGYTVTKEQL